MRRRFLFNALGDTGWMVLLVLAVLAAGVCIWLLYRYERKLISRKLGWTLLALRLLTVAVVFVTLLEPVVTWTIDREKTGRVLLSVDVSDSMSTADRHADKAEKLRWLRATGMIGNEQVNARLDRYLEAFKNDQEPEWLDFGEGATPEEREQIAAGRKSQLEELLEQAGVIPRKEIARKLITGGTSPLVKQIEELALVERQVFAGQVTPVDEVSFDERIEQPDAALRTESSDLITGLRPVRGEDSSTPLAGIVLFSDGRDNADPDGRRLLQQVATLGVPVYPVIIGSQQRPRDLAVGEVQYPRTIYQRDKGVITAQLRTTGFEGQELTVTLEHIDHPDRTRTRTIRPDDRSAEVTFEITPEEVGRQNYVLRLKSELDETRDDNNEKSFSIKVLDEVTDESRVLVLEGEARWEFRFLHTSLTRDEHVTLETVVFRQPYLGVLPGTFFPRELPLPDEPAADAAADSIFADYDVVLVGDVPAAQLPPLAWKQLDRFVREEGGTLVMTAGRNHFPQNHHSLILDDLLPATNLQPVTLSPAQQTGPPSQRGFRLWPTPEGIRQDMLQFDADTLANYSIWENLPGHTWGLKGRVKPAATVFLSLPAPQRDAGLEFERSNALMAHQHLGAGQTVWLGIDSTWRWRQRDGAPYHDRFWGQLCRWAAKFKASAGNENVRFGLERSEIDAGEDVLIRARWEQRFLTQHPDLQARAEVRPLADPDGPPVMTINLEPVDTRPTIHEGSATALEPGEYEVRLVAEGLELDEEPITAELSVAERLTTELAELSANRNLLEQIAEVSGGRVFFPDEVDQIPALFESVNESEHTRGEIALWDSWLVLLLCCGLLTTEWVLRKLNGLP
jgi:hypothetical protein